MDDDYIRPPDEIVSEQLLNDDISDYDRQINDAIQLSIQEMVDEQKKNKDYQESVINEFNREFEIRNNMFSKLLSDMKKIGKFDKDVNNIYEIIEPIISSYCYQYIKECYLDIDTYNKIFKLLGEIKTDKKAVDILKNIILHY